MASNDESYPISRSANVYVCSISIVFKLETSSYQICLHFVSVSKMHGWLWVHTQSLSLIQRGCCVTLVTFRVVHLWTTTVVTITTLVLQRHFRETDPNRCTVTPMSCQRFTHLPPQPQLLLQSQWPALQLLPQLEENKHQMYVTATVKSSQLFHRT